MSVLFGLILSVVTSASAAFIADQCQAQSRGAAMGGLMGSIMDLRHTSGPLLSGLGLSTAFVLAASVLWLPPGINIRFCGKAVS